jgi:hypothetical protein
LNRRRREGSIETYPSVEAPSSIGDSVKSSNGAVVRWRYRPSVSFLVALYTAIALALWWMLGRQQVYTCLALPPKCGNFAPPVAPWDWLQYNPLT